MSGRRGAVVEDDFYNKLERLNVLAGKKDKILLAHATRICEAHGTVKRSYYQQIHGSSGAIDGDEMEMWILSTNVNIEYKYAYD